MHRTMRYAELPLPPALRVHVAAVWTAEVPLGGPAWFEQEAVPDGCVELIRRSAGRSIWRREQPALFATGLATTTAKLRLAAGSRFTGVKLWPWTWQALGGIPCAQFMDCWIAVKPGSSLAALVEGAPEEMCARLGARLNDAKPPGIGEALLRQVTVAAVADHAGVSPRTLQRLFARDFGMPPRTYLRLLRLRGALAGVQAHSTLAEAAAFEGYADQAHMAREFRSLTGLSPGAAKARARGPFV